MSTLKKIRVFIVDDSAVVRKTIEKALSNENDIEVIGSAPEPFSARDAIVQMKPDVITLDIEMPRMDGITFLKKIMRYIPTPVIIISSLTPRNSRLAIQALQYGAVEVVQKPDSALSLGALSLDLASKIRAASRATVSQLTFTDPQKNEVVSQSLAETTNKIIAIGASTGGTRAIESVLRKFPANTPGIVIVQHMPPLFTASFANTLSRSCAMRVKEAENGDRIVRGTAYIAPGGYHMLVKRSGATYMIELRSGPMVHYQKPAVDILFKSVAKYVGANAVGVILTGMGADGAEGLKKMRDAGARTIAQDEKSSVVFGMPKEAIRMGAACEVHPLQNIPKAIVQMLS
jgi:two-component system chemotaxis response regulator CheB